MKLKVTIFLSTILVTLLLIPLYMIATPTHYKEIIYTDHKTTTLTTGHNDYSRLYFIDPKIKNENIDDLTSITYKWSENKMILIGEDYGRVDYNVYNGKIIYK